MTGGLLQLAAIGNENIYLNGNPQITYFKMVYKRYTNFSDESISVTPVGSSELEYDEEKTMKFKIDRHGDLVSNVYLAVTLPDIYSYYKTSTNVYVMKWIKHLGFHMIKSVTLYVGGQKIDSHSGEWLLIWNELFNAKDTKNHLFKMIGHTADMYKPYAENTSVYPLSDVGTVNTNRKNKPPSIKGRKLYIPLGFWFCRNSGLALPQIALQYHEVEIDIEFRSVKELYLVANKTVTASDKTINYSNLDFNEPTTSDHKIDNFYVPSSGIGSVGWGFDAQLEVKYIFLDSDERNQFAETSHEYLIEQLTEIKEYDKKENLTIELNIFHPVSYIVFVCKRNDRNKFNDYSNFTNWHNTDENLFYFDSPMNGSSSVTKTNYTSYIKDIVKEAKIIFNGQDRLTEKKEGYFSLVQKYDHDINSDNIDGIYIYSFSLNPKKYEPSGSCNMTMLNNVELYLELLTPPLQSDGVGGFAFTGTTPYQYEYDINVYIVNYNIFKVVSGMGGLGFAN